ncbi:MAG: hypothetical protein DRJ11_12240 [Candidatus Aminicenantes bacterium]|nr:MAG: hypothetical protein DRJ11_12240 [Candidatus Aminicenantes bacterium]
MSPPSTKTSEILSRLVGQSAAIRDLREKVKKAARYDYPVLITGETGVGKTLVAELIHELSERREKKFLHQSCSNISSELLESDLFGHERGAFTGADSRKIGKFEAADGGTLFLDEVTDLSFVAQAKLLQVLERREFFRVGGTEEIMVDVRIIAASNRDLRREVIKGKFREDLYYRLNVIRLFIPPLRERKEDLRLLIEWISDNEEIKLSDKARDKLMSYSYPGNVRELENVMKRAKATTGGERVEEGNIDFDEDLQIDEKQQSVAERLFREMVEEGKNKWFCDFRKINIIFS